MEHYGFVDLTGFFVSPFKEVWLTIGRVSTMAPLWDCMVMTKTLKVRSTINNNTFQQIGCTVNLNLETLDI